MNELEIKDQICDVCHKMWQLGWVAANDGNVSVKLGDGTYFATPTGISKSFITPERSFASTTRAKFSKGRRAIALLLRLKCTCAAIRSARM